MSAQIDWSEVDAEIYDCLNLTSPKSFFLFAGAGSGKTRSLVNVLKKFKEENSHHLRLNGQKIAIITYTNAACDEINRRLEFDSSFAVSTIHSFSWNLIKTFHKDIKVWVKQNLENEISILESEQAAGRAGTKAFIDRPRQIEAKMHRLKNLQDVRAFTYSPNGNNSAKDSLNHTEVISIAAYFLSNYSLMQKLLTLQYPVLLIDESQDTKKELIDAFFTVQDIFKDRFSLGLFGDTMQRIYTDGKNNLEDTLPEDWATPQKSINYRCPIRIVNLINKIRNDINHVQIADQTINGIVRLFVVDSNQNRDRADIESTIASKMALITKNPIWIDSSKGFKSLILEHHMAASRGGFIDFFEPLYKIDKLSTGLLDGSLSGIPFFTQQLLPLVTASFGGDEFAIAQIVKKYSPILNKNILQTSESPTAEIKKAKLAVDSLLTLWKQSKTPTLLDILKKVLELELFVIPEVLLPIAQRITDINLSEESPNLSESEKITDAWDRALASSFSQLEAYAEYISDKSNFGTHQGVKGLEFPNVMVILDDEEARGFLFSYEKLFEVKKATITDIKNKADGNDTSMERTRRLFYVTCSRAQESLAIVAYTRFPSAVKSYVFSQDWFDESEVISM